ncbi:hypothetical protein ACGC1H_006897 [Rhizoctonia solani]
MVLQMSWRTLADLNFFSSINIEDQAALLHELCTRQVEPTLRRPQNCRGEQGFGGWLVSIRRGALKSPKQYTVYIYILWNLEWAPDQAINFAKANAGSREH